MPFDPYWFKSGEQDSQGLQQWDFSGQQVLTLQPANHKPGYYLCSANLYFTAVGTGGNANAPLFSWGEPVTGASTLVFGAIGLTSTGLIFTVTRALYSAGVLPITFTITPASVTGSPRANLIANAMYMGRPVA